MVMMHDEAACTVCGGTGWKTVDRDGISAVERCECVAAGRVRKLEDAAGIPPLYQQASLENFSRVPDNPAAGRILTEALRRTRNYLREYPPASDEQGLLFVGDPGSGKTHLAAAVLHDLMARGFECVFFDYQDLLQRIRSSYEAGATAADRGAYQTAQDCEVLLLDDLGAHRLTDWVEDIVTSLLTHRSNHKRTLIATTNLLDPQAGDAPLPEGTAGEMAGRYYLSERIGFRARSRLFEMCRVVSTRGVDDYRRRKVAR